jgi:5-methyltetrahydrofolate--homocysteine methyltransferase
MPLVSVLYRDYIKQMPLIVSSTPAEAEIPVLIRVQRSIAVSLAHTLPQDEVYNLGYFAARIPSRVLQQWMLMDQRKTELFDRLLTAAQVRSSELVSAGARHDHMRSQIKPVPIRLPVNQEYGGRVVRQMPLEIIFQHLFINELFRLSWGAKNAHGEEWERLKADFELRLDKMKREALRTGWLKPQAVYGYWPAASDGDDLIIYAADEVDVKEPVELMRFTFPRQPDGDRLCLAGYFAPAGSGQLDVVAFQL